MKPAWPLILTALLIAGAPLPTLSQSDEEKARRQLQELRADIKRINREIASASTRRNKLQKQLRDADKRLGLAQNAREQGDIDEAIRTYDSLVSSGLYLDQVIDDVQQAIKSYPSNYLLYQVMGDAMMKDGRLQSALESYRQALDKLPK